MVGIGVRVSTRVPSTSQEREQEHLSTTVNGIHSNALGRCLRTRCFHCNNSDEFQGNDKSSSVLEEYELDVGQV
jgi:hypothetical protein